MISAIAADYRPDASGWTDLRGLNAGAPGTMSTCDQPELPFTDAPTMTPAASPPARSSCPGPKRASETNRHAARPIRPWWRSSSRLRGIFVGATALAGAAVIASAATSIVTQPVGWEWLLLAALTWLSAPLALKVPGAPLMMTISESLSFVIAIGVGWDAAVITVAVDGPLASFRQRHPRLDRSLFNVAEPALSMAACVFVLDVVSGLSASERLSAPLARLIVPAFAATTTYLLLNSAMTATAIAMEAGNRIGATWRSHLNLLMIDHLAGTSLALLVVSGARGTGLAGAFAALPLLGALYMTYRSAIRRADDALQYADRLNRLYLGTVESLAMAIDAKDQVTHGHITRVCSLARRVAAAMDLRDDRLNKALEAGALLHDVGKLGVPDHILNKPGPLTPAEYDQVKRHTVVGAEIVSRIDYPYPVAPIVRHHHENWDGTGYPDGLKGHDIPIGARILSVIDCYDALTSDRPYRPAMTHDEAMAIVIARRGTMYDPTVVDVFAALSRADNVVISGVEPADTAADAERLAS
jgi:putative nucleotidyltransferase with HDIG domain